MRKPRQPRQPRQPRADWKPYIELLKDPRWQKMRLQILERDGWKCCVCEEETKTLHVHHLKYERGKMPWEVNADYLMTLCEGCHEDATLWKKEIDAALAEVDPSSLARIAGFIQGMCLHYSPLGVSSVPVRDHEQACGIAHAAAMADGDAVLNLCHGKGYVFDRDDFGELEGRSHDEWSAKRKKAAP